MQTVVCQTRENEPVNLYFGVLLNHCGRAEIPTYLWVIRREHKHTRITHVKKETTTKNKCGQIR